MKQALVVAPPRGAIAAEGKTKKMYQALGEGNEEIVIVEHKNTITKHNDPTLTREFPSKGRCSTAFTCQMFDLLGAGLIPNAFIGQTGENEFLMKRCEMVGLEVVVRRLAMGSYFDRNPDMRPKSGGSTTRFHRLVFELFLKTNDGKVSLPTGGCFDTEVRDAERQDPFVEDPSSRVWHLVHPHRPLWDPESHIGEVEASRILDLEKLQGIEKLARKVFLLLEGSLAKVGCRLADLKLEFGFTGDSELVVADSIDPDSLRQAIWDDQGQAWVGLDKQAFRDGASMDEVERKYVLAAHLAEQIRLPRMPIVTWTGSKSDKHPDVDVDLTFAGIEHRNVVISGHKNPEGAIAELERILAEYPDGGVIIAKVGKGNGLGTMLCARTSWPVISVPADEDTAMRNVNVWSSLDTASKVPNLTVLDDKNAVLAAMNVLALKHPVAYMHRQYDIEELVV